MHTLIVDGDAGSSQADPQVLAWIGAWLSARRHPFQCRAAGEAARGRVDGAVLVCTDPAGPGPALLEQVAAASVWEGLPVLPVGVAPAADTAGWGRLWHLLQRRGALLLLNPVWLPAGTEIGAGEERLLNQGLLSLCRGVGFCRTLRQDRLSLDLADRLALAPLLI